MAKIPPPDTRSATQAFDDHMKAAATKIAQINGLLEAMKANQRKDPRNWGYTGSAGKVAWDLENILAFLENRDPIEARPR